MSSSSQPPALRDYPSLTDLTVGIEFEFYVHSNAIEMPAEEVTDLTARSATVPAQRFAQAATFVKSILDQLNLQNQVEVSNMIEAQAGRTMNETRYQTWIVTTDSALTPVLQGNTLPWLGLEVKTPIMYNRSATYRQLDRVGKALRDSAYTGFNDECGLHVHVGNGDQGFSVLTCQKLFCVLFLGGEWMLDVLFRPARHNNRNCLPMAEQARVLSSPNTHFYLSGEVPTEWFNSCFPQGVMPVDELRQEAIRKIWRAASVQEFYEAVNVGYRHSVTFQHLTMGIKPTIEFRKSEGNLRLEGETEFLLVWPRICARLVAFAVDADLDEFRRVIAGTRAALSAPTAPERLQQFLFTIRCTDYTVQWLVYRANLLERENVQAMNGGAMGNATGQWQ
ncbi:hypothetical protein SLS62_005094 [Diatrype stigma]|uniref:Amidoligase enzyme n=1 Tax=Diatrype stigma TaxID=117547 RepID=A0AAN9UVH0_9PEZI